MESDSNEDSDEEFIGDIDDSSKSSDWAEFVPQSQSSRGFILVAPTPIPELSSVNSNFHTLHLDAMAEDPRDGFGGGGKNYNPDKGKKFRVGHRFSSQKRWCIWV
ncbi:hypothetical protein PIB30_041020 [Stylosanthes scabra]|uniref:Uncharacterized protein n=1 Tax=Stylosanthes scabra TaxID=79078 RepID=A0ABU6ZDH0_9FABA|nr:hypothetical protein [Stylosanthes scabra]